MVEEKQMEVKHVGRERWGNHAQLHGWIIQVFMLAYELLF